MNDLTLIQQVIAPASDRLCGDDLIAGPRTIKFTEVRAIESDRGKKQFCIRFEGDNGRPWYPCKTMARAMVLAWSITDEDQMVGKSVTVYRDPDVDFGKEKGIGGVRISHMSHLPKAAMMKLTVSQGKKGQFTFQPLVADVRQLPAASNNVGAEKFTETTIAAIGRAPDMQTLDAFITGRLPKITELQAGYPDLYQAIDDALRLRREALHSPATDDDIPF